MAPTKGKKPEVDPWGWVSTVDNVNNITEEHVLQAYRILGFKSCEERRRNCKKNPYCCWGLGERKWVQDAEDEADDDDNGFREEGEFAGLQNLGATCYVNSLLQLWFHNPILRPAILRWQPRKTISNIETYKPLCPIGQLQAMFARMKVSKQSKIDPTEFVTSLKLDTGEQQDAQEFSKLFMEVVLNLLNDNADGAVRNSVTTAFRGELQNETECTGCNNKTRREEFYTELELGVRKNLSESLDDLLKDETLSGSDQYFCSMCNKKNDAHRRTKLLALPPVLNLQLMRFVFDRETFRKKKVSTNIQFPEMLDMTSRVSDQNTSKQTPAIYHLTALLVHNGPSASSGHYFAKVRDLRTGIWLTFNDETVKEEAKSKSHKLVLKEDEAAAGGSGSDTEKKGRKGKTAAGNHNSTGAYMLVYTLDRYVKNPEPDPELWPYVENLVKKEDEVYEEELKKSKNNKDYETQQREQRKMEIKTLYPSLNLNAVEKAEPKPDVYKIESEDDEDADFQPPKKMARSNGTAKSKVTSNGISDNKDRKFKSATSTASSSKSSSQTGPKSNGELSNGKSTPPPPTTLDVEDLDFISVDWLQQWLDPNNPPPPIENNMLVCAHDKLFPPQPGTGPTSCLYRIVPSNFAEILFHNYNSDGQRLKGKEALCMACVKMEYRRLKKLQELDDSFKLFQDINKSYDAFTSGKGPVGENADDFSAEPSCWISKEELRNWKRIAKKRIESEFQSSNKTPPEVEVVDDTDESDSRPLNYGLICKHEQLFPDESTRKLIPFRSWSIIAQYFPDAIVIPAGDKNNCTACLSDKKDATEMKMNHKQIASIQKSNLLDLYQNRNRPELNSCGEFYVVSKDFINRWIKFIREPGKYDPVEDLDNKELICEHGLYQYPLNLVADLYPHDAEAEPEIRVIYDERSRFCLLHPKEWEILKTTLKSMNNEIMIEITDPKVNTGINYKPAVCKECSENCWQQHFKKRFVYTNETIRLIRRDKDNGDQSDGEEDDLFTPIIPTGSKRDRKVRDPFAWQKQPTYLKDNNGSSTSSSVRRSKRPRTQRGEKNYKVSSSQTLKDLKVMILKDFKALPSDQHIFFEGNELKDGTLTLQELQIAPDSVLYLEIDTECKEQDEPPPAAPEMGFQGTLLMGGTARERESTSPTESLASTKSFESETEATEQQSQD